MKQEVFILSKAQFVEVLPKVIDKEDTYIISILDPDDKVPLKEDSENYKTLFFYDLEQDVQTYKAISSEQAEDLLKFILKNKDKRKCIVHCTAGVSRSGAVGEFIHELGGGAYKELKEKYPYILPSGRVLMYLRYAEEINNTTFVENKNIWH